MQHALENDMVHRDIKPANLIVKEGKKSVVKVLDFGLAKVTSEGQTDSGLTRDGQMMGTPDYIAPEQIRNAQSATTQPAGPSIELSRVDTQIAPTQHSSADLASSQPARPATTPASSAQRLLKSETDRVAWDSLIAIKDDSPSVKAAQRKRTDRKPAQAEAPGPRPPWIWPAIIAASVFAILTLAVVIYVATDEGRIKIVIDGSARIVTVDREPVRIAGLDEPMTLRAGEHALKIEWGNGEFETRKFVVRRGDNEALIVEYEPRHEDRFPPEASGSIHDIKYRVADQLTDQHPVEQVSWLDAVKFCNKSTKTVQSWEQGQRKPSQAALRLIQVFRQNPSGLLELVGMSARNHGSQR